jgi:site-specific recombinase XerD
MSSDVAGGCQVRFEVAVGDFERFLLVGKGASAATQQCCVRHVQAMLAELCDATGTIDLGRVSATWVRSYVTRLGGRYASQSLKLMATAVRSFLRYAWMSGWTAGDLTGAVGPVITHRSGRLPRALAAEDLRRLLTSPDRRTTTGLRDHALLVLLSRLGLRAGEVAGLCLDDFDWRAATVAVKVKGGGRLRLPIPASGRWWWPICSDVRRPPPAERCSFRFGANRSR